MSNELPFDFSGEEGYSCVSSNCVKAVCLFGFQLFAQLTSLARKRLSKKSVSSTFSMIRRNISGGKSMILMCLGGFFFSSLL